MSTRHTVNEGECLASIARLYGFGSWRAIYDAAENADFRTLRPNPNVICAGDVVVIPDKSGKTDDASVEQRHRYAVKGDPTMLRVVLQDEDGAPYKSKRFQLEIGERTFSGTTGGDGMVEQEIPADATEGTLTVWLTEDNQRARCTWRLRLGGLDPVGEPTGIQARLNNLGFDCGQVDGIIGPRTEAGVRAFQEKHHLRVDGIAGPQTQRKLKELHGC